jgi:hypothetical protein
MTGKWAAPVRGLSEAQFLCRFRQVGAMSAGGKAGLAQGLRLPAVCTRPSPSPHQADDHTDASQRWRLAAILLLCPRHGERSGVAHVVPGGLDPAIGTLDVGDAELVDTAIERIGDAAHMPRCLLGREHEAGQAQVLPGDHSGEDCGHDRRHP